METTESRAALPEKLSSEAAKAYLDKFFSEHFERHDFHRYITEYGPGTLASDFACALAHGLESLLLQASRATLPQAGAEPSFWVRWRSDGGYEGPIHNDAIERVRKESGGWTPLYVQAAPSPASSQGWQTMESAPVVGNFLVYLPKERDGKRVLPMTRRKNLTTIGDRFEFDCSKPTHWMPIPADPAPPPASVTQEQTP